MQRQRFYTMLFYRCQPDSFGDMPAKFVDDDSYSDDPPLHPMRAAALVDDRKRDVPMEPGLWLLGPDGPRRLTDAEAIDFAAGRLSFLNPKRDRV